MIAKKYRFQGQRHLLLLLRRGRVIKTDFFTLKYYRVRQAQHFRLAVIVSRKVDKKAVVRNRIRRRTYEFFRHRWVNKSPVVDLAVIVSSNRLATMSYQQFTQALEEGIIQIEKLIYN